MPTAATAPANVNDQAINDALAETGGFGADPATDDPADDLQEEEGGDAPTTTPDADADLAVEDDPDVEEIEVTGANGKEKIKIDYNDREATKRAFQKSAGVDKLYGRYKALRDESAALKTQVQEKGQKEKHWDTFETAYGEGGADGVEQLVATIEGGMEKALPILKAIIDKHERLAKDPAYAATLAAQRKEAEHGATKKELDAIKAQLAETKTHQHQVAAQSAIDAVFPTFSFAGKLGDVAAEEELDTFLFSSLQSKLAQAEGKGYTITPDLVRTILKDSASTIPKAIHQAARKMQTQSQDQASTRAKQAAGAAAIKGAVRAKGSKGGGEPDWRSTEQVSEFLFQASKRR